MPHKSIDPLVKKGTHIANAAGRVLRIFSDPVDGYVMARIKGCMVVVIHHRDIGYAGSRKHYTFVNAPDESSRTSQKEPHDHHHA